MWSAGYMKQDVGRDMAIYDFVEFVGTEHGRNSHDWVFMGVARRITRYRWPVVSILTM